MMLLEQTLTINLELHLAFMEPTPDSQQYFANQTEGHYEAKF